jgi:hypothetical protein
MAAGEPPVGTGGEFLFMKPRGLAATADVMPPLGGWNRFGLDTLSNSYQSLCRVTELV